ncbi:hypothetical protein IJ531_05665, partial [bacterium]|nr:hypothetical protein [bacterium]
NREITGHDIQGIMSHRPLQKFRPIKNAFTKKGDKILLSKALGIDESDISNYIIEMCDNLEGQDNIDFKTYDDFEKVKTYVYRHGTKEQVVKFLDLELKYAKDTLKTLYATLDYNMGGAADYFRRPIHRMDNRTLINLYTVVDNHLDALEKTGQIEEKDKLRTSEWALVRIYEIQNNSKLKGAIKTLKEIP